MMSEFIKYPSIEQFRSICKQVKATAEYVGYDKETNNSIFNPGAKKPILTFKGTVKIHGTNAGVCYNTKTGELWAQSRKNVITTEKDNAGFAFFVEAHKKEFEYIIKQYVQHYNLEGIVSIFGEWCGGNIQKGVGVCELDKMFVIFGVKLTAEEESTWLEVISDIQFINKDSNIYCVDNFPTYGIDINFECPEKSVNELTEITECVEKECPVAKYFGVSGIGEGVVWKSQYKDQHLVFKVKGEKHSTTKVKKLVKVDVEKIENIDKFIEYAVTENRLQQGIEQVFTIEGSTPNIKQLGVYLKWVMSDIIKEEMDTLVDNDLEPKDVGKHVSNKARQWFMEKYV